MAYQVNHRNPVQPVANGRFLAPWKTTSIPIVNAAGRRIWIEATALGLRFLRRFRLARTVKGNRLANERLEGGLVNFFSFVDVDRAACVSVETRVEETGRILQRRALGEGKLHDMLVGFASADDAVVRPNRSAHPLPLLDDVRVCFLDELAHSAEGFPAPVPEFGDSFRNELRCWLALARARLFHFLTLEVPDIFDCKAVTTSIGVRRCQSPHCHTPPQLPHGLATKDCETLPVEPIR